MFERKRLTSFGRFGAIVCSVYLVSVSTLYGFLLVLYSNWTNAIVAAFQALWLLVFGPPLVALWIACIDRFKHGDELKVLSSWVVSGLTFGVIVVCATVIYVAATYPWPPLSVGGTLAGVAVVAAPAVVPALLFLRDHRAAREEAIR